MRSTRAFTLLEMLITLAVFILLSAAIFGIVTGVLKSASSLQDNQNRGDQVMALHAFLKKQFADLPGKSTLISYRRGEGEGLEQNGIIFGTTDFLTAVDAKVQPNGLYQLRLATYRPLTPNEDSLESFRRALTGAEASLNWTSLIHDVQGAAWKFQETNSPKWENAWNNPTTEPNLVELTVQLAGDLKPTVMDLWIPPIYAAPLVVPTAAVTNSPAP